MRNISIITPGRNEAAFLPAAIQSVVDSAPTPVEHLVIDGGGQDEVRDAHDRHSESMRWVTHSTPERPDGLSTGPAAAFNHGLELANGDVIGWLNADDHYLGDAILRVAEFLASRPDVDVVYGGLDLIDSNSAVMQTVIPKTWNERRFRRRCFISSPSVFFRRQVLEDIGALDTTLCFWEEYDALLRLSLAGATICRLPGVLAARRVRENGRRIGNPCRRRQALVADELCRIQAERLPGVTAPVILEYAIAMASAEIQEGWSESTFDIQVLHHAVEAEKKWNGRRCRRWSLATIRILCRHVYGELRQAWRGDGMRVANGKVMLGRLRSLLGRKLFTLRQHAPRPIQLPPSYEEAPPLADPPRLSLVTPSYNQGHYLAETIRSVLDQGYPQLEYVIQDGGSTDESVAVIRQFESQLASWESAPDDGQAHAINCGMKRTSGDILAYLNSDDILLPGSLNYVASYFEQNPNVDVVYGHRLLIDAESRQIGRWVLPAHDDKAISWADYIPQETLFWRRAAWDAVGGRVDESFHFALDWDLILRFRQAGMRFVRLPRFLGAFRVTEEQKTSQAMSTRGVTEMTLLRKRTLGYAPTQHRIGKALRAYLRRHQWHDALFTLGLVQY